MRTDAAELPAAFNAEYSSANPVRPANRATAVFTVAHIPGQHREEYPPRIIRGLLKELHDKQLVKDPKARQVLDSWAKLGFRYPSD